MTLRVGCHHGHRFQVSADAEHRAVCPLCGSVVRLQGKVETKGKGALDRTINLPNRDDDHSATDTHIVAQTLASEPAKDDEEMRQSPPVSGTRADEDSARTAQTMDFGEPEDGESDGVADESEPSLRTAQTIGSDKTVNLDGSVLEAEDAGRLGSVTQTVGIDKTINIDGATPLDSSDDTGPTTADFVEPADTDSGSAISPTILLDTLGPQSPPSKTPRTDPSGKSKPPPAAKKKRQGEEELEPPDLPGYTVINELGRGGMGVVYRARHEKFNREVALKTLLHISPVELQRFKQEFRSLADIAHPNLAGLYDLLSDGETWCFSMEILEAVDFNEYVWSGFEALRGGGREPHATPATKGAPRLTAEVQERLYEGLKQLALGLDALHRAGMLHRDIKPSNVLVTTEGRVVLVDFGLASEFEEGSQERQRAIQGTPEYMAPEQAACDPISPATDWYAVGVMIYELLTGDWPIQGTPLRIIFKKQTETPRDARELEPSIPADLNDLCMRLLEKDASLRPTVADVLRCIGAEDLIETLRTTTLAGAGETELVGREGHLEGLNKSFKQVVAGATKSLFVHGKSGMGKSVLIQKFLDGVREEDQAVVLNGRCYEQESVPFKALDNLIDSLAEYVVGLPEAEVRALTPTDSLPLVRLFPVLGQIPGVSDPGRPSIENVDQQELRQRAMNALRELLKRLGDLQPLVLYIDDLQWGDEDSANLLADLVRPPDSPRVLVLGSYRSENRDNSLCLKALDAAYTSGQHHPHREEIAVDSLQEADAKRLALMLLGRDDDATQELAGKIARESGGWPFFVWELAQHVQDDPDIADKSLELDEVIWTRVNRLPEDTRRLLELIAVTSRPIPAVEAYQAIDAVEKGQGFLAQLRISNFIRTTESEDEETIVETYHDRIRESVVDHLDKPTIQGHSLNLALTIESASGIQVDDLRAHIAKTPDFEEPAEPYELDKHQWQRVFDLAYFFDAAGEHARAFPFALCAAEQARKQDAQEVAEQQFRLALHGAAKEPAAIRFRVLEGLASVLMLRGHYEEANARFEEARVLTDERLAVARIEGKLGRLFFTKGEMGPAGTHLESALKKLNVRTPGNFPKLVLLTMKEGTTQLLHSFFPGWFVGRRKTDTQECALDLFRARLLDEFTIVCWYSRGMEMTLWSHLRQMNLAERYPPTPELAKVYSFHSIVMTGIPLAKRGIKYATRSCEVFKDLGNSWGEGQSQSFHTLSTSVLGHFQEGVETSGRAIVLLDQAGDTWEGNMARLMHVWSLYPLGDLKRAYPVMKDVFATSTEVGDYSSLAIALTFWMQIDAKSAPDGAMQAEVDRERDDPLCQALAIQGRGLELLLREDKPLEGAKVLQDSLDLAKKKSIRNVCVFASATWRVTALRIAAERETEGPARRRVLKQANKAARSALWTTWLYKTFRAHLLRECGLLAVLAGREQKARKYFDDSIQVAEEQGARRDRAKSLLARGEAGLKFGWAGAKEEIAEATPLVEEMEQLYND